ncbi:MAG TPA: hypothetical protein VKU77_37350 [Streptosporangiaceae bacterium]|nr:hypothetical protein [Streptosporangiaceae bacterium]
MTTWASRPSPRAARSRGSRTCAAYPDVLAAARDLTAGLSPAEREGVFAGTATCVYGL